MKDINLLSLDLEMNQPSGKIIQVGYCIGNLNTGEILKKVSLFRNPNEELSPFIKSLTGITQDEVDSGECLLDIYSQIKDDHKAFNCFRNCLTWGGGDSDYLRKELGLMNTDVFVFGRRWLDVKTLFVSRCFAKDERHQSGLGKALTRVGLKFEGRKHNAMDDAVNTFRMYRYLLSELKPITIGSEGKLL